MLTIKYTFDEIVELVQPSKVQGSASCDVFTGIASLDKATETDISFLGNLKYKAEVFSCRKCFGYS